MKMITKRLFAASLLSLLLGTGVIGVANAETTNQQATFCTNIMTITDKLTTVINDNVQKINAAQTDRDTQIKKQQNEWLKKTTDRLIKTDTSRRLEYAKLSSKAVTPTQKAAVVAFETSLNGAIKVRQAAVDADAATFFTLVQQEVADRQTTTNSQTTVLKAKVSAAISTAKVSCAAGNSPTTVRLKFVSDIKAARSTFKAQRSSDRKLADSIKSFNDERKAADAVAVKTFNASLKTSTVELRKVFGSDADKV